MFNAFLDLKKKLLKHHIPFQDNFHDDRLAQSIPDIRVVLKNLLRYENSMKQPSEADSILTLSSRSSKNTLPKAGDTIDPIALLAAGFQGSRGKRLTFERIPLLAKGFQAHRGRK